ncbi:hypothetical protein PIIN_06968 [Serendipita indica DSM 11827]|uniref:Uncharacterized protein n=1 Tax=Serendipita indica (strain DSM 11827) TaxID=1109443 RepID=G4TNX0_SERID|nr:hypothetical protein PIIN_06968 [Serendipita indica DSM 11827]
MPAKPSESIERVGFADDEVGVYFSALGVDGPPPSNADATSRFAPFSYGTVPIGGRMMRVYAVHLVHSSRMAINDMASSALSLSTASRASSLFSSVLDPSTKTSAAAERTFLSSRLICAANGS